MPKLAFSLPNPIGQEEAVKRLETFMPKIQAQYKDMIKDLEQSWEASTLKFSFKTMGMKIAGQLAVAPDTVQVNIDLPLAAMMIKGRIEAEIRGGLERLLR